MGLFVLSFLPSRFRLAVSDDILLMRHAIARGPSVFVLWVERSVFMWASCCCCVAPDLIHCSDLSRHLPFLVPLVETQMLSLM